MAEPMAEEQRAQASLETRIAELEKRAGKARCRKCPAGTGCWALGSAIAVVLSWARNGSILWAILHGILSWIYVIYFALTRK